MLMSCALVGAARSRTKRRGGLSLRALRRGRRHARQRELGLLPIVGRLRAHAVELQRVLLAPQHRVRLLARAVEALGHGRVPRGRAPAARADGEAPPAADEVVWHLRLGDTVDCDDAFEKPCACNAKYVLQRPFFEAVAARLKPRSVVTLIYATQHAGCKDAHRAPPERSRAYVAAAIQLLRSRGFEVQERADGDPRRGLTTQVPRADACPCGRRLHAPRGRVRARLRRRAPGDGARARREPDRVRRAAPGLSE